MRDREVYTVYKLKQYFGLYLYGTLEYWHRYSPNDNATDITNLKTLFYVAE